MNLRLPPLLTGLLLVPFPPLSASQSLLIGSSSGPGGPNQGIVAARFDPATGALVDHGLAAAVANPGFLVHSPTGPVVYSAGETGRSPAGDAVGAIFACACPPAGSPLAPLNQQPTGGLPATHLAVDATGCLLVAVSYHGGQVLAFPLAPDGRLGPRSALLTPTGRLGPNVRRQDQPHPHSVTLSPDNRFAYVCDLGLDRVFCYRLDPAAATLAPAGDFAAPPGAGPRHSKFSADGRFLYVINELASSVSLYVCDRATGALELRQTVSTLPAGYSGPNLCAELQLHPGGRFVYGSNRGHDSLALLARDSRDGTLTLIETVPSGGRHPRHFALSPDGAWLVCANRDTHSLASYRIDPATGRLTPAGRLDGVPMPTCVLFVPGG